LISSTKLDEWGIGRTAEGAADASSSASIAFKRKYVLGDTIGVGSSSAVRVVVDRASGHEWACKIITNPQEREAARTEIQILRHMNHPNVVKYREHFNTRESLLIIFELLRGPDLHTEISKHDAFDEERARRIMRQLLGALSYIHGKGIVHRDLKLENIVLAEREGPLVVKLVDFGLAGQLTAARPHLSDRCGTPLYVAPEVISRPRRAMYGTRVDVWSAGVVFYILLSAAYPFAGATVPQLMTAIRHSDVNFQQEHNPVWETMSMNSKSALQQMLTKDPKQRPSAMELLGPEAPGTVRVDG
jgi:serine/threonine protein kinase